MVYVAVGVLCVALGAIGAVLPGLPTTPFLLLAAVCFAKGSQRAHAWLLRNRLLGPTIRTWERERAVTLRTKATSTVLVATAVGCSILWGVEDAALRVMLVALGLVGILVVLWLPTAQRSDARARADGEDHG